MLLPPPMVLSRVPISGRYELSFYVHCLTAWCRIPLIVLWFYLGHGFLYPACLGMLPICLSLVPAFSYFPPALRLHHLFSYDLMVALPDAITCFLLYGCIFLCTHFVVLWSLFSTIIRRLVTRTRGCNDIVNVFGLLIAPAVLVALCWIMCV